MTVPPGKERKDLEPAKAGWRLPLWLIIPLVAIYVVPWGPKFDVHSSGSVLISGASTGIGRHAAISLGAAGYHVFAGVRNEEAANEINNYKGVDPIMLDVVDSDSISSALEIVGNAIENGRAPKLVALVNNAGVALPSLMEMQPLEDVRTTFEVNLFGHLALTQACLPMLKENKGRIVSIGSILGVMASPRMGAYAASKFALEAYSDAMRIELRPFGVSVSLLEPAAIDTMIWKKADEYRNSIASTVDSESENKDKLLDLLSSFMRGPAVTSKAVAHAIQSPRPRARYPVAWVGPLPAWLYVFFGRMLPTRLLDVVFLSVDG